MSPGSRDGEAAVRAALQGRDSEVGAQGAPDEVELMHVLHEALPEDAIVIADMTVAAYWAALYLDAKRPGSFVYPASGALGCGVPLALGTAAAHPDRPTVAIVGDGGFLMGGHELLTARAEGLAFVTLVVNDSAYGILRNYQETMFGRTVAVELNAPDFAGLAEACGVRHIAADGVGGLGAALGEALTDLDRAGARRAPRGAQSTRPVGVAGQGGRARGSWPLCGLASAIGRTNARHLAVPPAPLARPS